MSHELSNSMEKRARLEPEVVTIDTDVWELMADRVRDLETRLAETARLCDQAQARASLAEADANRWEQRALDAERGAEELSQWRAKNAADPVSLSRKIHYTHRLGLDMSGQIRVSNNMLTAWEQDAESLERWLHELSMQMKARRAIDGWLAQFDGDDEVSYSVTEHPDTGLREYAVFHCGNLATFTDQEWYPSPAALADALLGEKWRET